MDTIRTAGAADSTGELSERESERASVPYFPPPRTRTAESPYRTPAPPVAPPVPTQPVRGLQPSLSPKKQVRPTPLPTPERTDEQLRHQYMLEAVEPRTLLGRPPIVRNLLIAYPGFMGAMLAIVGVILEIAHLGNAKSMRGITALIAGAGIAASKVIPLRLGMLRLVCASAALVIGVLVDSALR